MSTYRVKARREERFWVGVIDSVGATQARSLKALDAMARDLVVVMTQADPSTVSIVIETADVPAGTRRKVAAARHRTDRAAMEQRQAAQASREAAAALRHAGLNTQDTAFVMGVSPQRVSQLLAVGDEP